jgi:tetrathionate reductase subunit B
MVSYGMVINVNRCSGCAACVLACKDEYVGNDYPPYSASQPDAQYGYYPEAYADGTGGGRVWFKPGQLWVKDVEMVVGRFPSVKARYVMEPCMQCDDPPCMKAAQNGAIYKRPDGIVIIDPAKSTGQQQLVAACPYGRIYWSDDSFLPQKCTFCAHLIDQGQKPKCVEACPMTVFTFGDLSDPNSEVSKLVSQAEILHPEYNAKPKVYYIGLPK